MELFDCNSDPEPQYAAYRLNPDWERTYSFLCHGYWHVTNPEAWKAIVRSGAIRPNLHGTYSMRFADNTWKSYGYIHKCVALFDFISPSEEEIIRKWENAWEVLTDYERATILIQLDRPRLMPKIIPNHYGWDAQDGRQILGCIPFCEVWYPDEIATDAVTSVFRLPPPSRYGEFLPELIP